MQSGLPKKRREHVRASTPAHVVDVPAAVYRM